MKTLVKIHRFKKYEKYNLSVDEAVGDILLTGYNQLECSSEDSLDISQLVKKTYNLGKKLVKIINDRSKELGINEDDTRKLDKYDKNTINDKIKERIEKFISMPNKNYPHYKAMSKFYGTAIDLLQKYNIECEIEQTLKSKIKNWDIIDNLVYSAEELSELERNYKNIFNKVLENIDTHNFTSLINYLSDIPYTISKFNEEILNIRQDSSQESAKKIFEAIVEWCQEFGLPFCSENKKLYGIIKDKIITDGEIYECWDSSNVRDESLSIGEYAKNTVPINNFIGICLLIYEFYNATSYDNWDIQLIEYYHRQVMERYNNIFNIPLKIYEKKIPIIKDNKKILYNVKEYESVAIAAWDVFYHDYFGNPNFPLSEPIEFCDECQKEIKESGHITKSGLHLCNECFAKRKKIQGKERQNRFRKNKK